jgi:hypothetical protein
LLVEAFLPEAETMATFHMLPGAADILRLALAFPRMSLRHSGNGQTANGEQRRAKTGQPKRLSHGRTSQ